MQGFNFPGITIPYPIEVANLSQEKAFAKEAGRFKNS